jgi:hypothetical protein
MTLSGGVIGVSPGELQIKKSVQASAMIELGGQRGYG